MGAQQFGAGTVHIDTTALTDPIRFDSQHGLMEIQAGADWPAIIDATRRFQPDIEIPWSIRQKQTGADAMTLGGSISANAHGRGLLMQPLGDDIEDLTLMMADGTLLRCSREENAELFSLAIGGYGLFGIIVAATMRLSRRIKLRRLVDIIDIDDAMNAVFRRVEGGCIYGDFQYAIDPSDDSFLRRGVFACYQPVEQSVAVPDTAQDTLGPEAWLKLLHLAHTDKARAFALYGQHYLATHGQLYYSDTHQLSTYIPTYAEFLARSVPSSAPESLVIGEYDVPPDSLIAFMGKARAILRARQVEDIYGTIRSIRRDATSFLPWARSDYACVIFNLRTAHTAAAIEKTHATFRDLTDAVCEFDGSFYLTYHRAATARQVERCYPRFREFLALKLKYDPAERFQSDWYRHYRGLFGELST